MIELFVQSRYNVNRELLRNRSHEFLKKAGLDPEAYVVSIGIIGDRKMASLHRQFAKKTGTTPVLSFSYKQSGYDTKYHTSRNTDPEKTKNAILLGEVVISYPQTLIFAADENKLVDDKLTEFIEHGLTNLIQSK